MVELWQLFPAPHRYLTHRLHLSAGQAGRSYPVTAHTSHCENNRYQTVATITVSGHKAVAVSPTTHVQCNRPANNHCDVAALAPVVSASNIIGPGSFTCRADQPDLIWSVTLENDQAGSWQNDGFRQGFFNTSAACQFNSALCRPGTFVAGGRLYDKTVPQPCANEVPPWPQDFRTVIEVRRVRGPVITRTSAVASLSCPTGPATLTVEPWSGTGTGTVTSSPAGIDCGQSSGQPCSHGFTYGTNVTLTATPTNGSTFTGWSGDCNGAGQCVVLMNNTKNVSANFERGPPLDVHIVGPGSIVSSPAGIDCGQTCSHYFPMGAVVTLTAKPAPGSTFGGWGTDCAGTSTTCTLTMDRPHFAFAHFS